MKSTIIIAIGLIILSLCLIVYKIVALEYLLIESPTYPLWRVRFQIQFEGENGEKAKVGMLLPQSSFRQKIYDEIVKKDGFQFHIKDIELGNNRRGYWEKDEIKKKQMLSYEFSVKAREYSIFKEDFLEDREEWLKSTKMIPKKRVIRNLAQEITGSIRGQKEKAEALYQYVWDNIKNSYKKDRLNAYATLLEKDGTSLGKARLLCALLRSSDIPSRIVGGLILEEGIGKDIHFWVEAYVIKEGWIPFCPTNGYSKEIPSNYLTLYRADLPIIKKRGVKSFEYIITVERERRKQIEFISRLEKRSGIAGKWSLFSLPLPIQAVVRILLVVPLGALVVVIFRNVIGVHAFGTFTPILMALAFRETKLGWGLLFFFLVIGIGILVRVILDKMKLLLVPRLAILVTLVIVTIVILTLIGYYTDLGQVLSVALFPMVIMTMVIERFSITHIERGTKSVFLIFLGTVIIASAGYIIMSSELIQLAMFSFPEFLLTVVGILILLGRYPGLRLTELWRFRALKEG